MKNNKRIIWFLALFVLLMAVNFGCSSSNDDDDNSNNNGSNNSIGNVVNTVNNGSWRITNYFDTDHNETSNFTGYNFVFGSGNVLTATNGSTIHKGSWSVTDSNSSDDDLSDLHFNINFAAPADFEELSDDWEIVSKSATVIQLRDVSGGGGGTDLLTFTKN